MPVHHLCAPSVEGEKGEEKKRSGSWSSTPLLQCYRQKEVGGQVVARDGTIGLLHWDWLVSQHKDARAGSLQVALVNRCRQHSLCRFSASERRSQPGEREVQCWPLCSNLMSAPWAGTAWPYTSALGWTGGERSRTESHITHSPFCFLSLTVPPLLLCSPPLL